MIILVDMDDVLADFDGEMYRLWKEKHPGKYIVPPSERKNFYLREEMPEEYGSLIKEIYSAPGFVENLPEIPGGVEAIKEIRSLGHTVFICTSPLILFRNNVLEKFLWVEKHLGDDWTQRLILSRDKTIIKGDILIDDKPEITGAETPVWEHILFDRSYNKHVTEKKRLTGWKSRKEVLGF